MLRSLASGVGRLVISAGLAIAAVAAVSVPAPVAQAQPGGMMGLFGGMGGRGGGTDPTYTSRDIERAGDMLAWSSAQKEAGKAFLDSYQTSFTEEAAKVRTAMDKAREAFREDNDPSVWDSVRKANEALTARRTQLDKELMENLQAVCNDEQKAKWPKFERTQRRELGLERGAFLSGERVNLIAIVEKLELSTEVKGAVTPILDQYEADLDVQLQARGKVQEELQKDAQAIFGNMRGFRDIQNLDTKKIDELISKGRDASVRVREVNKRYAAQVGSALPADKKSAFEAEVQKQSFPDVYRQTRTARSLDAAIGFGDLTADQKSQIEALRTKYTGELASANEKLAEATAKGEMEMTAEKMMNMFGGNQDDPVQQARTKKRELGRSTDDSLKSILTEEQVKRLPADDNADGGGRGRGGPGGGGPGGGGRQPNRPRGNGGGGGGF